MDYYRKELYYNIEFHQYLQFKFSQQWKKLKSYANANGIHIIGDIPIYVAMDSADIWAHPEPLEPDRDNIPTVVTGCPSDGFSATGQLWGNPLYRWEHHRNTGYEWWLVGLAYCYKLYDMARIDHSRGFGQYHSVPAGSGTVVGGCWEQGPGIGFFHTMRSALGEEEIAVEDLGYMTDSVRQLVKDNGFPGMKVLESASDPGDSGCTSDYFPHSCPGSCMACTGAHGNKTIKGWYASITAQERELTRDYLYDSRIPTSRLHMFFIGLVMCNQAKMYIIPLQDYMGLDNDYHINTPSVAGINWRWRPLPGRMSDPLVKTISSITPRYGR